jgi:polynucleotide 5'-hydroxyl-kinase GRC3/NOL9
LQEIVLPAEWNKKLQGLAAAKRKGTPAVFLCGPKSSGKSTFGRVLANRLMTDRGGVKSKPWSSVMVLDLDPGQPEYSPPGVISLCKITAPNLSPPFCHPTLATTEGQQLRAHAIASATPAFDPAHYIECVVDLFNYYRRGPDAKLPLVVNTPGWIQGTGLDILAELITAIRPTEVVYMSQDGPEETVKTLQSACTTISPPILFSTLPSQPSDISSRTSLHFRTMQTMSYFHLRQPSEPQQYATWDPTPLTELRPWRVRYSGPPSKRGFLGVLCYDHQPAPELLAEAINGTVLALVKAENRAAFRDLLLPPRLEETENTDAITSHEEPSSEEENKKEGGGVGGGEEGIPLIPNPQGRTLDPRHSRLLGLVLVRGIDTQRKELQLLTPLAREVIAGLAGEETVLVAGRFDTPSWAYSEELYRRAHVRAHGEGDSDSDSDSDGAGSGSGDSEELEEEGAQEGMVVNNAGDKTVGALGRAQMEEVPWVEMLHGNQKRAVGSKVWRVRRDLGRN